MVEIILIFVTSIEANSVTTSLTYGLNFAINQSTKPDNRTTIKRVDEKKKAMRKMNS